MSFKNTLIQRMQQNADASREQRDREWQYWWDHGGSFEAIKYPELATPPSQRTAEQLLTIIQREIQRKRDSDE